VEYLAEETDQDVLEALTTREGRDESTRR